MLREKIPRSSAQAEDSESEEVSTNESQKPEINKVHERLTAVNNERLQNELKNF